MGRWRQMIAHLGPMNNEHERSALWSISKSLSFFDEVSYQTWISSRSRPDTSKRQLLAQLFRTRLRNRPLVTIILCAEDIGGPLRSSLESLRSSSSGLAEILVSAPSESADGVRRLLASVNLAADAQVLELDGGLSAAEAEARASELARGRIHRLSVAGG